jgi:hypothetical protein
MKKVTEMRVWVKIPITFCGFEITIQNTHGNKTLHTVKEYVEGKGWQDLSNLASKYILEDLYKTDEYQEALSIIYEATKKYKH